ncbi:MAG: flagellar biosynthetic protein FliR [Thermosulfidibacteraceae bacterium]|jgi:flagellar biosynthetic protein FliR
MRLVNLEEWYVFLILLVRASLLVFFMPVIGSRYVPSIAKVALALFMAYIGYNHLEVTSNIVASIPKSFLEIAIVVLRELLFAYTLSIAVRVVFNAVELAGEYVSYLMGFSVANILDPTSEGSVPLISHLENIVLMLVFLFIGGHLWFIYTFNYSIDVFPPFHNPSSVVDALRLIIFLFGKIFVIALYINAPILIVMIIVQFVLAITTRILPQLNVFMVGFPLQIFIGFLSILISLNIVAIVFSRELLTMRDYMESIIKIFGR